MQNFLICIALAFAVTNGFHDGCNVIATLVASRSMTPRRALLFACLAEFFGAIALGTAVALTIGKGILTPVIFAMPQHELHVLLISALLGGVIWNVITWIIGLPSSSSHALIGGLVGASLVKGGLYSVEWANLLNKVILPLFLAPVIGFIAGYILMKLSIAMFRNHNPSVAKVFKSIQGASMMLLAAGHGSNDSQKAMGIIAIALAANPTQVLQIPYWVIVACASAITLGLSVGGWRIIKTISKQVSKITPLHSFDSQLSSGVTVYLSSKYGFPVSTTQIVGSSIMGVGAGYKVKSVRWAIAKNILSAWLFTIPASAVFAAIICLIFKFVR